MQSYLEALVTSNGSFLTLANSSKISFTRIDHHAVFYDKMNQHFESKLWKINNAVFSRPDPNTGPSTLISMVWQL